MDDSVSGQKRSSCASHLYFVSYWADQSIEEAVLRGQQLRQEKTHSQATREYDVVNIDFIKPRSVKECGHRRKKYPKKSNKKYRSKSPSTWSQSLTRSIMPKKRNNRQKSKTKAPCGIRIAELAVPTKRHCLETWKNKYNTLPAFMIERLRQKVMDQQPVAQISDAIYCFKRKSKRRRKNEKPFDKTTNSSINKIKKLQWANEVKTFSAIFGYKIAKNINLRLNIILNSDLEKMAKVVSYEIADLMSRSKNIDMNNKINMLIHKDISEKVTIWVSGVLDESTINILEDQIKDFEEEAGPALDFIDDLVDGVLDICIPRPEIFEEPLSGESDDTDLKADILDKHISTERVIEDYFRSMINTTLNDILKDGHIHSTKSDEYLDVDDVPDWQLNVDIEAKNTDIINGYLESEEGNARDQSEDVESKEKGINYHTDNDVADQLSEDGEAKDTKLQNDLFLETGDDSLQLNKYEEEQDTKIKTNEYLKSEYDVRQNEMTEISLKDIETTETLADATAVTEDEEIRPELQTEDADKVSEIPSDEQNKKVTFNEVYKVNFELKSELENLNWKASIDRIDFAEPNEDLLSYADESWPEEIQPPVLRPSESVSKSITSLGKINEDDEKMSVRPEDKASEESKPEDIEAFEEKTKLEDIEVSEEKTKPEDIEASEEKPKPEDLETSEEKTKPEDINAFQEKNNPEDIEAYKEKTKTEDLETTEEKTKPEDIETSQEKTNPEDKEAYVEKTKPEDLETSEEKTKPEDLEISEEKTKPEDIEASEEKTKSGDIEASEDKTEPEDIEASQEKTNTEDIEAYEEKTKPEDIETSEEKNKPEDLEISEEKTKPEDIEASEEKTKPKDIDASQAKTNSEDTEASQEKTNPQDIEAYEEKIKHEDIEASQEKNKPVDIEASEEKTKAEDIETSQEKTNLQDMEASEENIKPEDIEASQEKNKSEHIEAQIIRKTIELSVDDAVKHEDTINDSWLKEKISSNDFVKSKNQTNSKDSEKVKSKKRESRTFEYKPSEKTPAHIAKTITPRKFNKTQTSPGPSKRIDKTKKTKEKTSTIKVESQDIESARASQNVIDMGENLDAIGKAKDDKVSSLRVKPKPDYKVNVNTAPMWVNRNFGKPSCSCVIVNIPPKPNAKFKWNDKEIRRWCRDLEQGYKNLKMWNEWLDNTSRTVSILQRDLSVNNSLKLCTNKEWIKLKRNIDKDAVLWKKLNQNTRERLIYCKKMYQKGSEIPSIYKTNCYSQPQ